MSYEEISCKSLGNLMELTFERPEQMNSLTPTMIEELNDALQNQREEPETRAIILTGSGDAFCAGADVSNFKEMLEKEDTKFQIEFRKEIESLHTFTREIHRTPKPIIAGVNGSAAGAGLSLAIACDLTLISEGSSMSYAYSRIGLTGDGGATFSLPRIVGTKKALELAFKSPRIKGEEAVELGLANEVLPAENFREKVREVGRELADGPTVAFGLMKDLLRRSPDRALEKQLEYEKEAMAEAARTSDFEEGVKAFLEKENPDFTGT